MFITSSGIISKKKTERKKSPKMMAVVNARSANSKLIFANVALLGVSLILITLGGFVQRSLGLYAVVLHNYVYIPVALLFVFGFLLFFISFFGFGYILYELDIMRQMYVNILFVVIFLELCIGCTGLSLTNSILRWTLNAMLAEEALYANRTSSAIAWDTFQTDLNCCGVHNYTEWFEVLDNSVPDSCCRNGSLPNCGLRAAYFSNVRNDDCTSSLFKWAHSHRAIIAVVFVALIVIKLVVLRMTCNFSRRNEK